MTDSTPGWQARLELGFEPSASRTVLAHRRRNGPLAVQRPFYPEGEVCHVVVLHPPGGVVGGDRLELDARVAGQASALLTTPGATKFYRSGGPRAELHQRFTVADRAGLEWLPQETILFPGADLRMSTQIELHGDAKLCAWEVLSLGRPAIGEGFNHGHADLELRVLRDGEPVLWERLRVGAAEDYTESNAGAGTAGLRGCPVTATMLMSGADDAAVGKARDALPDQGDGLVAVTHLDGLLVVRYLGRSSEQAKHTFIAVWRALRPVLHGRPACPPRIWAT